MYVESMYMIVNERAVFISQPIRRPVTAQRKAPSNVTVYIFMFIFMDTNNHYVGHTPAVVKIDLTQ